MSVLAWIGYGLALVFAWLHGRERERRITVLRLQELSDTHGRAARRLMHAPHASEIAEKHEHRGAANALMQASAEILNKPRWKS